MLRRCASRAIYSSRSAATSVLPIPSGQHRTAPRSGGRTIPLRSTGPSCRCNSGEAVPPRKAPSHCGARILRRWRRHRRNRTRIAVPASAHADVDPRSSESDAAVSPPARALAAFSCIAGAFVVVASVTVQPPQNAKRCAIVARRMRRAKRGRPSATMTSQRRRHARRSLYIQPPVQLKLRLLALVDNVRRGSRGAQPAGCTLGRVQARRFDEFGLLYGRDDELRDAHAAANDERLGPEIDKNNL